MLSTVRRPSRRGWLVLVLPCLFVVGCAKSDDEIKTYRVANPDEKGKTDEKLPNGHPPVGPVTDSQRILGAIYPADNPTWFFKVTGSDEQLEKYAADFDKLTKSVRLQGDVVPTFTLPEGWTLGGPRSVSRMGVTVTFEQTIKFGPANAPLEITISRSGGGLMMNVDRWAKQIGLSIRSPADLSKYTKEFAADQVKGIRVDLRQGQ